MTMAPSAVSVAKPGGSVAVVTLAKEPVNSMDLDLWRQLQRALDVCEADPEARCSSRTPSFHALALRRKRAKCAEDLPSILVSQSTLMVPSLTG